MNPVVRAISIVLIIFVVIVIGILSFIGMLTIVRGIGITIRNPFVQSNAINRAISAPGMMQNQTQTFDDFLNRAVNSNQISQTQKDAIVEERNYIQNQIDTIRNAQLTNTERQNQLQQLRENIYKWSTTNKIPLMYLGLGGPMMRRYGYGMM